MGLDARHQRRLPWASVLAALICASGGAVARADSLASEMERLEATVQDLEQHYLAPELLEARYELTARLSEGQLYYLTRDYERASMVLLDLVEKPTAKAHPAWKDAIYYLADSLYHIQNYSASGAYFERVVELGDSARKQKALGRLLEIAVATGNLDAARRYLGLAQQEMNGNPEPALLYSVGKYHYRMGALDRARPAFERVPITHEAYVKTRYFLGVLEVREGQLDKALESFQAVVDRVAQLRREDAGVASASLAIGDLAVINRARIFYEQGLFDEAESAYSTVRRDSPHFDDALYEGVWIAVKQKAYERALRKLEILLISQPDVIKGPDAKLLQGKLLMMLKRYGDAALAFQEVLFEFTPILQEMQTIQRDLGGDLVAHFNKKIGRGLADFDLASILPPRAMEFAGPDIEADRALTLVVDLGTEQRDLDDANRTIERLDVAIKARNRVEIFPKLHEGWLRAEEVRSRVVELRARSNDDMALQAGAPGQADYDAIRQVRDTWRQRFEGVPKTAVELQARDARVDDEMLRLDQAVFNISIDLSGVEAQLTAIRIYLADLKRTGEPSPQEALVLEKVRAELDALEKLRREYRGLVGVVERERTSVGIGDEASQEDRRIRDRYVAALDAEERWLTGRGSPPDPALRARLDQVDARARNYMTQAEQLVVAKVGEIKRQIDRERRNVEGYQGELVTFQGETESLGGRIAARSFTRVQERVQDVILEADVGLIDVAWKQKDDQSKRISRSLGRQRDELARLKAALEIERVD